MLADRTIEESVSHAKVAAYQKESSDFQTSVNG